MPATPSWYPRIPGAIAALRKMTGNWPVSRQSIETMLGVGPRRAQQLMNTMPLNKAGNMVYVQREVLLAWLEKIQASPAADTELQRRQRVENHLLTVRDELHARKTVIYSPKQAPAIRNTIATNLPDTTVLRPGELQIRFTGMEDLMRQLVQLSQALQNDYMEIEKRLRP